MSFIRRSFGLLSILTVLACSEDGRVSGPVSPGPSVTTTYRWENPLPQGNSLQAVAWRTSQEAFAVGGGGTLLETTDAGESWQVRNAGTTEKLNDVAFFNADAAVLVGDAGTILRTRNGGRTWSRSASATDANLRGVWCFPSGLAFAVGGDGVVCVSADFGDEWTVLPSLGENLEDVAFATIYAGVIVGDNGATFRTTDGGQNWAAQPVPNPRDLRAVQCLDVTHTVIVADGGSVFRTEDAGVTWAEQDFGGALIAVHFFDDMEGVAAGAGGALLRTTDGGVTWVEDSVADQVSVVGMAFRGDAGIGVGSWGAIVTSSDRGVTWSARSSGNTDHLESVAWNGQRALAIGRNGSLLVSNGVGGWDNPTSFPRNLNAIAFANASRGWIVGENGTMLRTIDGGETWGMAVPREARAPAHLFGVDMRDSFHVIVVGNAGYMQTSFDGGTTWLTPTRASTRDLYAVAIASEFVAVAVGSGGDIVRTEDGGATWTLVDTGFDDSLYAVDFWGPTPGVAVGANGSVLRTFDAGETWQRDVMGEKTFLAVSLSDAGGVIAGEDGALLECPNYMTEWTAVDSGMSGALQGAAVDDAGARIVVGMGGAVLRREP